MSSRSYSPYSNAALASHVDILAQYLQYSSDELGLPWSSWGGAILSDDEEFDCYYLPRSGVPQSTFITCHLLRLVVRSLPRSFHGSGLTVTLFWGHPNCSIKSDSALYARFSKKSFQCSAHHSQTVLQIRWIASSANRALRYFSSHTDLQHCVFFHNSCAYFAAVIYPCVRLCISASSFAMFSSVI